MILTIFEKIKNYMRIVPIQGLVNGIEERGSTSSDITQLIYTNTNLVNKITEGDILEVESTQCYTRHLNYSI